MSSLEYVGDFSLFSLRDLLLSFLRSRERDLPRLFFLSSFFLRSRESLSSLPLSSCSHKIAQ